MLPAVRMLGSGGTYMRNDLMSTSAIVLKDVVLNGAGGLDEFFGYRLDRDVFSIRLPQYPDTGQVIPGSR
jgi:hypothetical protein